MIKLNILKESVMNPFFHHARSITAIFVTGLLLSSCGGGGDSGGGGTSSTPTISGISRYGVVAPFSNSLSLTGTNFANGMTLRISGTGISNIDVTPTSITSTLITANSVSIPTAPTNRYVTVSVMSGTSVLASTTLGVASISKTLAADIQPIFNTSCAGCHTGGATQNYLNLTSGNSASNLISTSAVGSGCGNRLRVKAGDPRATSSVLIDKISNATPCTGNQMTGSPTPIGSTEISAITEWIAGGAN